MYLRVVFKALLAMGSTVSECGAAMEAMRTDARSNAYHNPMAISQILPALQQKTYLHVRSKECLNEDGTCRIISYLCDHCVFGCVYIIMFVMLCSLLQILWCWSLWSLC